MDARRSGGSHAFGGMNQNAGANGNDGSRRARGGRTISSAPTGTTAVAARSAQCQHGVRQPDPRRAGARVFD